MKNEPCSAPTALKPPVSAPFPYLVQSAILEFHAALQLLAERARFLTAAEGVAIAVEQGSELIYVASQGSSVPAIDDVAQTEQVAFHHAIAGMKTATQQRGNAVVTITPILQGGRTTGFIELVSKAQLRETETASLTKLAALSGTAMELRDAAQQAEHRIADASTIGPAAPKVWHAPQSVPAKNDVEDQHPATANHLADKCWWCGFPVSQGRKLCVECEEKNFASMSHASSAIEEKPLFDLGPDQSWISEHGYTIATVLVSALAAAVVYLLR
jgi:hypothetical protein